MKKLILPIIIGAIIIAGGSFYGGMVFGKSQVAEPKNSFEQFGGNTPPGGGFQRMGGTAKTGGAMIGGKVLSIDTDSVTIELPDGGSKIIYFSDSTEIMKSATGVIAEVVVGTQISAVGTTNDDGSVTAKTIQIRPEVFQP